MLPLSQLLLIGFSAQLTSVAAPPITDGRFLLGSHSTKIEELKEKDLTVLLAKEWSTFDTHAKDARDMFSGKLQPVHWSLKLTPPFPTNWPPVQSRSVTYYAYAEYQELFMHGPMLSRSAPWAKVVLNEGMQAKKVILARALGPSMHGDASAPISSEQAVRLIQIKEDGAARLNTFIAWKAVPGDAAEVKVIREYYCHWILTDRTSDLIKNNHRAFFEWLACPPR